MGKDSQWWGPGYHGALLLSNNAEPLTMIKFTGPEPQILPWVFKYLGPFQYNVFVTRLEKDRIDFPEPYLWGMRFAFKPHPVIELGVERTAILGGQRQAVERQTSGWTALLGKREHATENPGDQRVGYDVTLTLPFQLSARASILGTGRGGELATGRSPYRYDMPSLCGIYLPRIFGLTRLDLRAEYARESCQERSVRLVYAWVLCAGYTYQGMIIGHHMGTESRDIFLELSYLFPERSARYHLSYDQEEHTILGCPLPEMRRMVSAVYGLSRMWSALHRYGDRNSSSNVSASFGLRPDRDPGNRCWLLKQRGEGCTRNCSRSRRYAVAGAGRDRRFTGRADAALCRARRAEDRSAILNSGHACLILFGHV